MYIRSRLVLPALLALLYGAAALPALASGSASSASSEGSSASVGASSTSIQKSSDSSSGKDDKKVAAGDYRIVEITEAPARAGTVRLKLQPVAADAEGFFLYMPHEAFDQSRLAPGHVITAKPRDYGVEFVAGQPNKPFFLVLADEWFRELRTRPVTL